MSVHKRGRPHRVGGLGGDLSLPETGDTLTSTMQKKTKALIFTSVLLPCVLLGAGSLLWPGGDPRWLLFVFVPVACGVVLYLPELSRKFSRNLLTRRGLRLIIEKVTKEAPPTEMRAAISHGWEYDREMRTQVALTLKAVNTGTCDIRISHFALELEGRICVVPSGLRSVARSRRRSRFNRDCTIPRAARLRPGELMEMSFDLQMLKTYAAKFGLHRVRGVLEDTRYEPILGEWIDLLED